MNYHSIAHIGNCTIVYCFIITVVFQFQSKSSLCSSISFKCTCIINFLVQTSSLGGVAMTGNTSKTPNTAGNSPVPKPGAQQVKRVL